MVRVLLVDDQVSYRRLLARLLRTNGFDVVAEAGTGREALLLAAATAPELVVLDVLLPDFDGFEVARRLEAGPVRPAVVLVSGRQRADFGEFADLVLVRGFLGKDEFTVEALVDLLAEG
ncbi:response regulator [Saccharothrix texasensis]|uniref:Response regulator receiver domain-containing protein n=1 Tax=Saccharothrix texasensis TaxID=103734 RepID=A0A3N1HJW4_9PSEU|nr:response regulator [Saccharothrix texasensis]ROP42522.1 response regulator receiver domain-containing protein [Saccharothrix texasensis]